MRRYCFCALAIGLVAVTTRLGAQFTTAFAPQPRVIAVDARVRMHVVPGSAGSAPHYNAQKITGTIRGFASDTVYLQLSTLPQPMAIPRDRIRRAELSINPGSRVDAALQGGVIVGTILAINMWFAHQDPETRAYDEEWKAVSIGAAMGFSLGGYMVWRWNRPFEVWRDARLPN